MRVDVVICDSPFSYTDREKRVRADHPLRVIREIINPVLKSLSGEFAKLYLPALGQLCRFVPTASASVRRPSAPARC